MAGIRPDELAERSTVDGFAVAVDELERWLLGSGLATSTGGLLWPTRAALELGAAIE
jgi:hypothetical protein